MLQFFRKYQKYFFIVMTIVIVISFSFFGTFSTMISQEKTQEISQRDAITRLISPSEKGINLISDGVIPKDFMEGGLALILAEKYFAEIKPDLESRLKKVAHYRPYVHPQVPFISAEMVWQRFSPALTVHLKQLQEHKSVRLGTFVLLAQLYQDQLSLSSDLLKRILFYQQNQQGVAPDPFLAERDLSLFGFHNLEDWFGSKFVQIASEFILHAASYAAEKGYAIKKEEARADLVQHLYDGLSSMDNSKVTLAQAVGLLGRQAQLLGMDEHTLVSTWQQVMLFRRLFQDVGASVFVDPLSYENFFTYASEAATVDLYELPDYLQLSDFRSLLKLQLYIDSVSQNPKRFALPRDYLNLAEVEKRAPELVQRRFELELVEVKRSDILGQISLKQTWDWQLENGNWELLQKEFPILAKEIGKTHESRFAFLETLDAKIRYDLDTYSRDQILNRHPEWIVEALNKATLNTRTCSIRAKGGEFPFAGLHERTELLNLLQVAPLKDQKEMVEPEKAIFSKLRNYTADHQTYYRIHVLSKAPQKSLLTFREALYDGTLDQILDKKLEDAYPEARRKDTAAFQNRDGSWKPFADVKDKVGAIVYADLIDKDKRPLESYAHQRLIPYMNEVKKHITKNPQDPKWVSPSGETTLENQWLLVHKKQQIQRGGPSTFNKDELFSLSSGQWSTVQQAANGNLLFFQLTERTKGEAPIVSKVAEGQQIVSADAQKALMAQLVSQFKLETHE